MHRRFTAFEVSFFFFLLVTAVVGVVTRFVGDPAFWTPVMQSAAGVVVVGLLLNAVRLFRSALTDGR